MSAILRPAAWTIEGEAPSPRRFVGLWGRLHWLLRRLLCGLMGHDMVKHFEPQRLSLRCLSCGAETRGWTLVVKPEFKRRRTSAITHPSWAGGSQAGATHDPSSGTTAAA